MMGKRRRRTPLVSPPNSTPQAVRALHEASHELARVRSMWGRVNSVSDQLDLERERNHFGARFAKAIRGNEP